MTKQEREQIELEIAQIKVVKGAITGIETMDRMDLYLGMLVWFLDMSTKSPFQQYTAWVYKNELGKEGLLERRNQDRRK